jgi:thiamine biosynthesis lipoprotein
MGTEIELILDLPPSAPAFGAIAEAEHEVRRLEGLLSRFEPDSELSRLNQRGTMVVGPELLELVGLALAARKRTRGRFDPTVHDALVAAGYDRTFDRIPASGHDLGPVAARCAGAVAVDPAASAVELDPGVRLDLGGIAKGYAADRAAAILTRLGPCLVDAGGDIAVHGRPWPIGVESTDGAVTLELADGGLATSGRDRRRWMRGGEERHHLIDPTTARPADGDLLRVTVVATSAAEAEVLAKALFFADSAAAVEQADGEGIPAVLLTRDGRTLLAGGLA